MKIKRTSNVVNMMEESALNYHIVLQRRINKIASWMSLKNSEINNYSWIISAVLIFPFCSSSYCQACFPSIVRSMRNSWELTLKIFFNSPDMNRSILFSLHLLRVTKKMDYFLRNFVRRERVIPWFNINPIPCVHRNDTRWIIRRFPSLWFCFRLWSVCKILHIQLQRLFFRLIFRNFCVVVVRIHHKFIWSMRNSDPGVSVIFTQRPNSNLNSMFAMQATGRNFQYGSNFRFSLHPSSWLWWSIFSWKSVFTTSHCMKLCEFRSVFSYEILSDFNNTQKSCIHTKFTQFILLWQLLNSSSILLQ